MLVSSIIISQSLLDVMSQSLLDVGVLGEEGDWGDTSDGNLKHKKQVKAGLGKSPGKIRKTRVSGINW